MHIHDPLRDCDIKYVFVTRPEEYPWNDCESEGGATVRAGESECQKCIIRRFVR